MCISWTNKEFETINARYKYEDYGRPNLFTTLTLLQILYCSVTEILVYNVLKKT
jgi:hypothetical protein